MRVGSSAQQMLNDSTFHKEEGEAENEVDELTQQ